MTAVPAVPDPPGIPVPVPDGRGVRRRTVHSGGLPLAVYEQGDPARPAVLMVHGYPDTHRVWDDVAAALAADHHVIRYDVRGAGDSPPPGHREGYRLQQLSDDLFAVARAVSPDRPVHVVAHDWGSLQAWDAVTRPEATGRIASYTSVSGVCLDHMGYWIRHRLAHPTPRHLAQLLNQAVHSWYIGLFHLPVLAPAAWRLGLADRWGTVLRLAEGVTPRPGHPQPTLADDAVNGISLYRANMLPRLLRPEHRPVRVPVQLLTLTRDHYVGASLYEDLERWAPRLWQRSLRATHWSGPLEKGTAMARMIGEFVRHQEGGPATPALRRARRPAAGSARAAAPAAAPRRARPFDGQLAVITGAGSGIGRATALAFAEQGADLALCDVDLPAVRRTAHLAGVLGATATARRVDVSDGAAMDAFADEVARTRGVPDIVVNNAGIGHAGSFLATTEEEWQRVLDVNLWGVIHGCRAFAPLLAEHGTGGHIVNIASAAAYLPSRTLAAYATSKAAVLMLSDCLRAELARDKVAVTAICPGIVRTGITRATTFSGLDGAAQEARRRQVSGLYARRNYTPERVAEHILRAVRTRRATVPVTVEARAARLAARVAPGLLRATARLGPSS